MRFRADLATLLASDPTRMDALRAVRSVGLPDCWIGAGFVRDAVWDHLHGYPTRLPAADVDVVWFEGTKPVAEIDREIEGHLHALAPGFDWSVKNQARMHHRNGDAPYSSVADAMCHWPETATAVAVRLANDESIDLNAPLGLDDLFSLRLVPTDAFATRKRSVFDTRVSEKLWLERYPLLVVA